MARATTLGLAPPWLGGNRAHVLWPYQCAHRLMGGADNFYADNVTTSEDTVRCVALEIMAQTQTHISACQSQVCWNIGVLKVLQVGSQSGHSLRGYFAARNVGCRLGSTGTSKCSNSTLSMTSQAAAHPIAFGRYSAPFDQPSRGWL